MSGKRKRGYNSTGNSDGSGDAIAEHYDRRAAESSAERRQCRVLPLRNANNGAKARLIEDALRRAVYRIRQSSEEEHHRDNNKQCDNKQLCDNKQCDNLSRPIYVLDLGCGKGGDLLKYARASETLGIDIVYYGVDLSGDSIAEARKRASETRGKHGRLVAINYRQGDFCAAENAALDSAWLTADIVSVQFALHYAFASVSAVRRFFDNVGRALASDGELIGTLVDHACLVARLENARQQQRQNSTFGNSLYQVSFEDSKAIETAKSAPVAGVRYRFALDGCIDDCDEFLVDRDYLRSMASVVGLDLKIWLPIQCLYSARDTLALTNDAEQREIADLYAAFVFARTVAPAAPL